MSIILPLFRPLQQFYRSNPSPCPYIPGRVERKLFTRLSGETAQEVNATLAQAGFRRSHDIAYRPICPGCTACVPVRVPVAGFRPDRTQRRIARRNADLTPTVLSALATEEHYRLFLDYQHDRHEGGDMGRMSFADYASMLEDGGVRSLLLELRDDKGTVRGAMLSDRIGDGLSAVYSFYDPSEPGRSLGTGLILALIDAAREAGLPYVYLGYWIEGSRKMDYKGRFRPFEILGHGGWTPFRPTI